MNLLRVIISFVFLTSLADAVNLKINPGDLETLLKKFDAYGKKTRQHLVGYIDLGPDVTLEVRPYADENSNRYLIVGNTFKQKQRSATPKSYNFYDWLYFRYNDQTGQGTFYGKEESTGELKELTANTPVTFIGLNHIQRKGPYLLVKYFNWDEIEHTLDQFQRSYGDFDTKKGHTVALLSERDESPSNAEGSYIEFIRDSTGSRKTVQHLLVQNCFTDVAKKSSNSEDTIRVQHEPYSQPLRHRKTYWYFQGLTAFKPKQILFVGMDVFGICLKNSPAIWLAGSDWEDLATILRDNGHAVTKETLLNTVKVPIPDTAGVAKLPFLIKGHVLLKSIVPENKVSVEFDRGLGYFEVRGNGGKSNKGERLVVHGDESVTLVNSQKQVYPINQNQNIYLVASSASTTANDVNDGDDVYR